MLTRQEWNDRSKTCKTTQDYSDLYRAAKEEAIGAGAGYMQGKLSAQEVGNYLCSTGVYYPFDGFTKTARLIARGVEQAIKDGTACASRTQPVQESATLAACRKKKSKKAAQAA